MRAEPASPDPAKVREACRKYAHLQRAIERAGFFVPHLRVEEVWDALVCTSRHIRRYGYTGFILLVTKANDAWYISTMHPHLYRVVHPRKIVKVCLTMLHWDKRHKSAARLTGIDLACELVTISYEEYIRGTRT